eukprot:TRINITY_DN6679_c0_g2_i2.p1 TRINITY_DN6679_c0_g2~~TRINITY_DN6679_c0_g2_i2.p1  ORF type:complete len:465 (-),score=58.45 TRINITY_DN6679_c0_g2_i2:105-1499(-)
MFYPTILLIVIATFTFLPASAQIHDSIVIGGGISGVAAAADLYHFNVSFVLLEARVRIGGRIWTDRSLGVPCDLGASWIHHSGPTNPITIEANKLGIPRNRTDENSTQRWSEDGVVIGSQKLSEMDAKMTQFLQKVDAKRGSLDEDVSLAEVMQEVDEDYYEDPEANFNFAWDLESDYGGPIEDLSAIYYDSDSEFPGKTEELFPTGYDTLIYGLAARFQDRIFKNKVVTIVDYTNPKNITVTCQDGSVYYTRTLIITVPLGVLKAGSIIFKPQLPGPHLQSINKLGMGVAIDKIFMKFDDDFWSEISTETFFSSTSGNTPETRGRFPQFLNGKKVFGVNVLLGFAFSTYARNMESKTDEEIKDDAMLTVKKIFPNATEPSQYVLTRWYSDPYSRGAYSFLAVGSTPDDFDTLAQPVTDQIFLAGEHTILKYKSSVHGGYLSGKRAAGQVLNHLSKVFWNDEQK